MSIAVTCPQCRLDFDVPPEFADARVRCLRCAYAFIAQARPAHADGIQVGTTPRPRMTEDEETPRPSPQRPTARTPFPWGPIAIVTIGVLFLLLAFSGGFNLWLMNAPNHRRFALEDEMQAEMEQRMVAEQARQQAIAQQEVAQVALNRLQQELVAARKQVDDANAELVDGGDDKKQEWGSLEGKVTWKGALPVVNPIKPNVGDGKAVQGLLAQAAKKGLLVDPMWRIDAKDLGVANVVVFIKRPKDGAMPIHRDDKVRKDNTVIDSPFLVFEPHVSALYEQWFDGKERGPTGQKLVLKNSATVAQNVRCMGDGIKNDGFNVLLMNGGEIQRSLHPQTAPLELRDDIYNWKLARLFVFDHPYYAISKADGTFTIPRVPAGMEVQVMAWHEAQGWLFTKNGKAMTLKAGKNTLDFEMSAK